MHKEITTTFESAGLRVEGDIGQNLVTLRLNEYVPDEENSSSSVETFKETDVAEVYLSPEELKEMIASMQEVLNFFERGVKEL